MKIYIAGPMRGYPRYNFDAFHAKAAQIRALGHEPLDPAQMDEDEGFDPDGPRPLTRADYRVFARRDTDALLEADAIALLDGWEKSAGVAWELPLAMFLGLAVFDPSMTIPEAKSQEPLCAC